MGCDWLPPEVGVVVELDQAGGGVEAEVLADAALETREAETQEGRLELIRHNLATWDMYKIYMATLPCTTMDKGHGSVG